MKKSALTAFIKEEILGTLNESPSTEEIRMAKQVVARFMKYRNVGQDEAIRDLENALDALKQLEESTEEEIEKTKELKTAVDDLAKAKKEAGLSEEEDASKSNTSWKKVDSGEIVTYDSTTDYFSEYELLPSNIYDLVMDMEELEDYGDTKGLLRKFEAEGWTFDYGLDNTPYGLRPIGTKMTMGEEEDAPAGDAEVEKSASKEDIIVKDYNRLRKELKKHLEMYKDAEGDQAKETALKMMKKISQSAEYIDAKEKYEKLKKVKE